MSYYALVANGVSEIYKSYEEMIDVASIALYPKWGKFYSIDDAKAFLKKNKRKEYDTLYEMYGICSSQRLIISHYYSEVTEKAIIKVDTSCFTGSYFEKGFTQNGTMDIWFAELEMDIDEYYSVSGYVKLLNYILMFVNDVVDIEFITDNDVLRVALNPVNLANKELDAVIKKIYDRLGGWAVTRLKDE